jgi:hypothetical protein
MTKGILKMDKHSFEYVFENLRKDFPFPKLITKEECEIPPMGDISMKWKSYEINGVIYMVYDPLEIKLPEELFKIE